MLNKYLLYGFKVESEIKIEEAYKIDFEGMADIKITIGEMPQQILEMYADKTDADNFLASNKTSLCFRVGNVADYLVTASTITVRPIADMECQEVKTFLLGSAFGYLMILHKKVVLHGGAVAKNGRGIIVTGESGAGKSTVTNALQGKDYEFIADDVCALSENEKNMHINMAYPQQKLCRDAALKMGYELEDLVYINEERDKFAVRLKDGYLPKGNDFHYLFEIVKGDSDALSFAKLEGTEKLHALLNNIYRGDEGFALWGIPPEYMKQCLKVASTVEIYRITRPENLNTLPEIVEFIESKVLGVA